MDRTLPMDAPLPWVQNNQTPEREQIGQALQHFWQPLCAVARKGLPSKLRSKTDPEDLVQEVFQQAFCAFSRFAGKSYRHLSNWLHGILRKILAKKQRFYGRKKRQVGQELPLDAGLQAGFAEPLSRDPQPDVLLQWSEQRNEDENVIRFLFGITEQSGGFLDYIMLARYRWNVSCDEVARKLGIPRKHFDRLMEYILAMLKGAARLREVLVQQRGQDPATNYLHVPGFVRHGRVYELRDGCLVLQS